MAFSDLSGVSRAPTVLILAAGCGERFRAAGGLTDKLDALFTSPAGTRTVLEHVLAAAEASGLPWHVVQRQDVAALWPQGMGTSIAAGVNATADAPGWLILPGDLPLIQPASLQAVAHALQQHAVVVPMVQGQRGHPVGFGAPCRIALQALQGDEGARSVLQQHMPHRLVLQDMGCIWDVDTPELLAQAQKWVDRSPP